VGTGISVGVLEAKTCDRCAFGLTGEDVTVQARVVNVDGAAGNTARVKDVDGV
jgi:hypothetical protein